MSGCGRQHKAQGRKLRNALMIVLASLEQANVGAPVSRELAQ
jgi:hypothetical protein